MFYRLGSLLFEAVKADSNQRCSQTFVCIGVKTIVLPKERLNEVLLHFVKVSLKKNNNTAKCSIHAEDVAAKDGKTTNQSLEQILN